MASSVEEREAPEFVRRANVALPGLYAWAATVLYPVSIRGVGVAARVAAGLAAGSLIFGVLLSQRRPAQGRALGLHGFVAFAVLTWVLLGGAVAVDRLEPTKAALGMIGWVLFAFGWGASREPERVPEDDPRVLSGQPLSPRGGLPRGAAFVLVLAIVGAAVPIFLAWRVTRAPQALFAHAVAVVCAVGLVSSGAEVATLRGSWVAVEPPSERIGQAALPLTALGIVLLGGAIELLTR